MKHGLSLDLVIAMVVVSRRIADLQRLESRGLVMTRPLTRAKRRLEQLVERAAVYLCRAKGIDPDDLGDEWLEAKHGN